MVMESADIEKKKWGHPDTSKDFIILFQWTPKALNSHHCSLGHRVSARLSTAGQPVAWLRV
jgi:hypothetical protein